jgi:hypothetical protein
MKILFFLAETGGIHDHNITDCFSSLEELLDGLEAIDVANGAYEAFNSIGQKVEFTIVPNARWPDSIYSAGVSARLLDGVSEKERFRIKVLDFVNGIIEDKTVIALEPFDSHTQMDRLVDFLVRELPTLRAKFT